MDQAKKTIFILDDEVDFLYFISYRLKYLGYEVIGLKTAKRLWEVLERKRPDLIITDLMLEDSSGVEVCKTLKETRPDIPVLLLTCWARGVEPKDTNYFEEIMLKPFDFEDLIGKIEKITHGSQQ